MKETEVKLKSSKKEHEMLAKELVRRGFKRIKTVNEVNILYEHPSIPLKSRGNVLRIRHADKTTMTFKGRQMENKHSLKVREEYEVTFSDSAQIENILHALGFRPDLTIRKKRTVYRKGPVEVDLDTVQKLGHFIEIEANEKNILSLLKQLHLDKRERITQGYAQLIREAKP